MEVPARLPDHEHHLHHRVEAVRLVRPRVEADAVRPGRRVAAQRAQAAVVVAGNVRLHKQLGVAGMLYGALVFAVGLLVSVGAPALRVRSSTLSATMNVE